MATFSAGLRASGVAPSIYSDDPDFTIVDALTGFVGAGVSWLDGVPATPGRSTLYLGSTTDAPTGAFLTVLLTGAAV